MQEGREALFFIGVTRLCSTVNVFHDCFKR